MSVKKEVPWYSEEAGLFGEVYMKTFGELITGEQTLNEVNFLEKALNIHPGMKIFDLCCGHGRHSVELARRGYDVTGQDLNGYFLNLAEKSAVNSRIKVKWIKDDMRNINFEKEFDIVINMFTAFGYFGSDEEDQKVFYGISRSLKSGGRFVIDIANCDKIKRNYLVKNHKYHQNGILEVIDRKYDFIYGGHNETRKMFFPDGSVRDFNAVIRFYTVPELITMMNHAGMSFVEAFGDFDFSPISFASPNYILIGQKQ